MQRCYTFDTEVEVDVEDVLDDLTTDDILDYLEKDRDVIINDSIDYSEIDYEELKNAYFHGDFDLKKFMEMIKG